MFKKSLYILLVTLSGHVLAQNSTKEVKLKSLAPPNSPAFVLMDVTPTTISTPQSIQALSIQTLNAFSGNSNNNVAPNSYAIELQPYWYKKRTDINFFTYNNLVAKKQKPTVDDYVSYNPLGDLWKKLSVSIAFMNGTYDVFEKPQSYISVGVRTRLLSIVGIKHVETLKNSYKDYEAFMSSSAVSDLIFKQASGKLTLEELDKAITSLDGWKKVYDAMYNSVNGKPVFALDGAIAYSHFMGDASQDIKSAFGRFGIWFSGDLALKLPSTNQSNYFHVYGIYRYLRDGLNKDADNKLFITTNTDYGGKLEFEMDKLSVAYEYLQRDGVQNETRSFGTIRYQINKSLTLHGGFGRNFKSESATTTILGIQWGLDFSPSVNPISK
ncbi:conserved exported protein of unknown function [Tenacibaculum sp. 190524A02b]|uniref:hypothetical protein n=1 Tax=Tenacibaculum vairaonense TaxID=3137860 RepID=UPI0032B273B3